MIRFMSMLLIIASNIAAANKALTFSTPPTQTAKATKTLYQPIVDYIAQSTGRKVKLIVTENFIQYSQGLLQNKFDIVFDGPQFIGWRIQRRNHEVIAKLPRKLNFLVFIREDSGITNPRKLAGKRVCGIGSPNLMTLGFLDLFPNPASIPSIVSVRSFKHALQCVHKGRGVAGVVRNKFWYSRKPEQLKGLRLLHESKHNWPDRGFSISKSIDKITRDKVRKALLDQKVQVAAHLLFAKYKTDRFVPAKRKEYAPLRRLLRPIWGFHQ